MTRWIEVPITQLHIDTGISGDCSFCMLALALREATGAPWKVLTDRAFIDLEDRPMRATRVWQFSPSVRALVYNFDNRPALVRPGRIRLPARFASDRWRGLGADVEKKR